MKYLPILFLVFFLPAMKSMAQPTATTLPRVTVSGNKFMVDGKPVVFRGLDASDPDKLERNGHWNKEYFEMAKSWGANIIRFPVHPTAWRSRG